MFVINLPLSFPFIFFSIKQKEIYSYLYLFPPLLTIFPTKHTNYFSHHYNVHFYFALLDLGEFDLEKEKSVVTLKELLEDCIRDTDNSQQLSELVVSCPSLRTQFYWSKFLKLWKRRSFKHLPSFPPSCVPNITKTKNRTIQEISVVCNSYCSRTLMNFSLDNLRNATNNFSNGL